MTHKLPLARQSRPTQFAALHGHSEIKKALLNTLNPLKHHAYLLVGERGLGKTTLGRLIAQKLLCENATNDDSCGKCSTCVSIQKNQHPDVLEVDAASHSKVEETREIISQCSLAPLHSNLKIYLIDEVHMLSTHSFNALLKTLEEPPAHVVFILATTHEEKIPPTVRSRCLKFFLSQPSRVKLKEFLVEFCEKRQISFDPEVLQILVDQAEGSYRDLLNLLEYALALAGPAQLTDQALLKIFSHIPDQTFAQCVQMLITTQIDPLRELLHKILTIDQFCPKKFTRQFLQYLSRDVNFTPSTPGLYTEISKFYTLLEAHPDPKSFLVMSLLRLTLLIAKKKAQQKR